MRYLILFLICVGGVVQGTAQVVYPEIMEIRESLIGPVKERIYTGPSFPESLRRRRLEYSIVENPGVRYSMQNLKREKIDDPQINEAINTLIKYADDVQLKIWPIKRKRLMSYRKRSPMIA